MKNNTKPYVKKITRIALFVAIISVLAQISIPISLIPITLQTFAIALCGFVLDRKSAIIAVIVYLTLGGVGVPVFASFNGGFHVLLSYTGGFLWGFIPFVFLSSLFKGKMSIFFGILGLILCHLMGVVQYSLVSKTSILISFTVSSLFYVLKDVILVVLAYFVSIRVNKINKGDVAIRTCYAEPCYSQARNKHRPKTDTYSIKNIIYI